ncbi:MAG: aminotransferase class V-fold PLP-dependent enzyme [Bacteroides sp.]|nr:aminotransferase class V-fold PLP-dependent enzyme [Bacteroides sp.]MCM1549790.1 aminotransferase class V-fold PLP-dependent enzyme [Clostridium sp.]
MAEIYLDHAATTAVLPQVVEAMVPYYTTAYYNPSSVYQPSQEVRKNVEGVREQIAAFIGAMPEEIYFTSGGTEADNWALATAVQRMGRRGHMITSTIEHHAIGHTCRKLERSGCSVTYLPVDGRGRIHICDLKRAIQRNTVLVSIMYANNEIGTIQPVTEIGEITSARGILFHTDAVQACGQIPIDVRQSRIDLLSASAHKFRGPKGVGFLYVRKGLPLESLFKGGGQERGFRAGTENVPGIIGMGKALEIAVQTMEERRKKETLLRDYLMRRLMEEIPYARINGHRWFRLPNNINVSFRFVNSESLLVLLDMEQICASGGSACNAGSAAPSHVIEAIRVPEDYKNGTLRLTLGEENTMEEMNRVVSVLKSKIEELRRESPEYEDFQKKEQLFSPTGSSEMK